MLTEQIRGSVGSEECAAGREKVEDYEEANDKVDAIDDAGKGRETKPSHYRGESFGNCLHGGLQAELRQQKEALPVARALPDQPKRQSSGSLLREVSQTSLHSLLSHSERRSLQKSHSSHLNLTKLQTDEPWQTPTPYQEAALTARSERQHAEQLESQPNANKMGRETERDHSRSEARLNEGFLAASQG